MLTEVLMLLGVVGLLVLLLLGSYRRRSSGAAVKVTIWVAYTSSYPLVNYTLGLMQSSPYNNDLFSVWALCLFLILGSVDSLSAYSLQDNENWKRFYFQEFIMSSWVVLLISYGGHPNFQYLLWVMYAIIVIKCSVRVASLRLATGRNISDKGMVDYMSCEHELCPDEDPDPVTMRGYRYVIGGDGKWRMVAMAPEFELKYDVDKLLTVDKGCQGSLLRGDGDNIGRLKDVCLSMALSNMLNRRFAGLELAESNLGKTHDFLFHGLLHGDNCFERAFRVIEEKLAFVHDFFYTKYYAIYSGHHLSVLLSFSMIPFCSWLAYKLFRHFQTPNDELKLVFPAHNRNYDALITFVLVVGIAWCKVALISNYVVRDSWKSREWVAKSIGCITGLKFFRSWEDKLVQYTLLQNCNFKPINILHRVTFSLVDKTKNGRKKDAPIKLSMAVKRAVMEALKSSNGELTNGVTSLQANGVLQKLSWSYTNHATTTHTILAWHIATTLCEAHDPMHQPSEEEQHRTETATNRHVASSLSRYCAYLVAFAPELLPDHCFISESTFDSLIIETQTLLEKVKTLQQRCEILKEVGAMPDINNNRRFRLTISGAQLGNQLIHEITSPRLRWKVMSNFWAEMMMYIAP
uniref:DUF4220 domain-containing protein n=1 Tax=Oryza meridionalis TaxID=40149 RepID=A0A0E0F8L3_9ORYZ